MSFQDALKFNLAETNFNYTLKSDSNFCILDRPVKAWREGAFAKEVPPAANIEDLVTMLKYLMTF